MNASSRPLCDLSQRRIYAVGSALLAAAVVLIGGLQCGCVALNIPSQRHHDPGDNGGILGSWEDPARPGRVLKEIIIGPPPTAISDGCDEANFEPSMYSFDAATEAESTPEVPWPKYHPVPTRPVFGG